MDYLATAEHVAAIAGAVVMAASAICAKTRTPDPNTRLGKVYRYIEMAALVVGRAKDMGVLPTDPKADKIAADMVAAAGQVLDKPSA